MTGINGNTWKVVLPVCVTIVIGLLAFAYNDGGQNQTMKGIINRFDKFEQKFDQRAAKLESIQIELSVIASKLDSLEIKVK